MDAEKRTAALITGGSSGIGFATAAALMSEGFDVTIVGRNRVRGESAAQKLRQRGSGVATFVSADLSTVRNASQLANQITDAWPDGPDVVVHNVGGMYVDRKLTDDGIEATLATNVVTPLAITRALLPRLEVAAPSRVVFVNSDAHKFASNDLNDLEFARDYRGFAAYGRAKLLQLLVARALTAQLDPERVTIVAVNPGAAWTRQIAAMTPRMMPPRMWPMWPMIRLVQWSRSPEKAARAVVRAATDASLTGTTNVWIGQDGEIDEPSEIAQDDTRAAETLQRIDDLVERAQTETG